MYIPSLIIAENKVYSGWSCARPTSEDGENTSMLHTKEGPNGVDRYYSEVASQTNNTTPLPSIIIEESGKSYFHKILRHANFTSTCISTPSVDNRDSLSTLAPIIWSNYANPLGVVASNGAGSRMDSYCTRRAHVPDPGINSDFPSRVVTSSSRLDSLEITSTNSMPPSLSSEISSRSCGNTTSPLNYIAPIHQQIERQLYNTMDDMLKWVDDYEGRSTMASVQLNDVEMDTIDNNELQLVEEVIRDFGVKCDSNTDKTGRCDGDGAAQAVPDYDYYRKKSLPVPDVPIAINSFEGQKESVSPTVKIHLAYTSRCVSSVCDMYEHPRKDVASISSSCALGRRPSMNKHSASVGCAYVENQIPLPVFAVANDRSSNLIDDRKCDRHRVPWPSLNLPSIKASEQLKEGLNVKDVERAMSNLLKRPIEELATPDEDGDTVLMCLVGNPEELMRKKAYLAPLVERLSNTRDSLSRTNNRGEDALYLAAITCPVLPYVTGYLAAVLLQKGTDIGQKLYHTRGDTLIHSVAARGDTHGEVLAELLALKTSQGHSVFDLSKRNYDGRTALHVAVGSHDPFARGVTAVATVQLLLENGADPRITETKSGDTALHMATSLSCDPALVKVLLSHGAYTAEVVNALNYNYNTPLHMAAAVSAAVTPAASCLSFMLERQKEVCQMLVEAGGQINLQNRQGKTPLALVPPERKDIIRRISHRI